MILGISGGAKVYFESLCGPSLCRSNTFKTFSEMVPVLHPSCKLRGGQRPSLSVVYFCSQNLRRQEAKADLLVQSQLNFKIMIACES